MSVATSLEATVTPADLGAAVDILKDAAASGQSVAFRGGGTELGFGYAPGPVQVVLGTERLSRVVEYAAADMVAEVEAGITLAALQDVLAPYGQRLALDAPQPEHATLGGLVATNAFGPRRARYGSLRDLIVGVSLIRADGVRVRGGGKVVKNVAGFDLPKLAVGSLGTLGMLATMTFRLHPLPETAVTLCVRGCRGSELRGIANAIVAKQLEPAALLASRRDDVYDFYVQFEGFGAGVAEQAERFAGLARELGGNAERLAAEADHVAELDGAARTFGSTRLRLAVPPGSLDQLERDALGPLARALGDTRTVVYPSLGIAFVSANALDAAGAAVALTNARAVAERLGGNLVVLAAGDPVIAERVDVYGTLPGSFPLMQRLKERFDPARRLNPGRFLGGL